MGRGGALKELDQKGLPEEGAFEWRPVLWGSLLEIRRNSSQTDA